jgi:hypothetical protein
VRQRPHHIDIPIAGPAGASSLVGWRKGYPKFGGITPMLRVPLIPFPGAMAPAVANGEGREEPLKLEPGPRPPDIDDIEPPNGARLNGARPEAIVGVGREGYARPLPPPMRYGMKPPKVPAYGMTGPPADMPEPRFDIDPP